MSVAARREWDGSGGSPASVGGKVLPFVPATESVDDDDFDSVRRYDADEVRLAAMSEEDQTLGRVVWWAHTEE